MGQGQYVLCEWDSIQEEYPEFQQAFMRCEQAAINSCNVSWAPRRFDLGHAFGGEGFYGRTTILPGLFMDHNLVALTGMATWRQAFTSAFLAANPMQFTILAGVGAGNTIPEGTKVALMGFAFPNKQQHITEIKMQIGDRKYGRINLEVMQIMNKPAIIFDEGIVLEEEEAVDIYAHMDTVGLTQIGNWTTIYQRMVPIGAMYYQYYQKVGGVAGSTVPVI